MIPVVDEQADRRLKGQVFRFDILTEKNELKIWDNKEKGQLLLC